MGKGNWWTGRSPSLQTKTIIDPLKMKVSSPLSDYLSREIGKGLPRYEGPLYYELSPEAQSRYTEFLSLKPEDWFREKVTQPTMETWREEVLPVIEESWAGSLRGSGRYRDVEDAYTNLTKKLAEVGGQQIPSLYSSQIGTALAYKGARDIDYEREYKDWLKSLPEMNPAIEQALAFLGKPTGMDTLAYFDPGSRGLLGDLLGTLAQVVGMKVGQKLV